MIHPFIFTPAIWLGEGKIQFSGSTDVIKFYTRWIVSNADPDSILHEITAVQTIEMQGESDEVIQNHFTISQSDESTFILELENDLIGVVQGTGVTDPKKIAWEFRGNSSLEGFEVYELQEAGDYLFHAEYISSDQFRSIIDGHIWKKIEQ